MADKTKKTEKTEKGLGIGKILLVVFMVFIITPLLIFGIIYYTNDNVRMEANKVLITLPGPLGEHFRTYPTKGEIDKQKISIAQYLVEIDNSRAIDKLTLIKNEDEVLYNDIIKLMLRLKPDKAKTIIDEIRKNLIKKDILLRTVDQIEQEKEKETMDKAKYYESISPITVMDEVESAIENNEMTYSELADVFQNINDENAAYLLQYIDENKRDNIINNFAFDEKKNSIRVLLSTMKDKEANLKNTAEIYSTENPEELVGVIGNTETYSIDDLAVIYKNIGLKKAAQVLSKINDEELIHELVNVIKEREILSSGEDLLTNDLLKAYKVYRDFDKNVAELTSIYEKMSDGQIAELIKRMIRISSGRENYPLNNGETITISDEDIALSILSKFNERKLAAILTNLDSNLATEITKKLSMPNP
ncbi:hypothetical protein [Maledivibacter halophilus]|uniref:Flagellar motility protein MotE, a chaperone for MotC folding n=1 Tax=Maledivibacter halophilus TaxID=36842 RepID=A0A1T5LEI8_9FIRM|nr:hypothetical protein [Maledivibacter halophilus]SKC74422.1 hypothetical protein SAMN02194393_02858 [Maledivibacter halophilus]